MKKELLPIVLFAMSTSVIFVSCSNDDDKTTLSDNSLDRDDVVSNYSAIILKNYQDAQADAQALKTAINTFTSNPTQAAFEVAKQAWLTARESYGPSEAYRFANGPIDSGDTEEIEGLLNSWPLD
jgi:putative iron-regulated protein